MARKKRSSIDIRGAYHVVIMGDMEIWDGADLALLRETLSRLVEHEKQAAIGVDMTSVKYIPSGFFGMLYDHRERGAAVRLYDAQAHVQRMLWFREFFQETSPGVFDLHVKAQTTQSAAAAAAAATAGNAPWNQSAAVPQVRDHHTSKLDVGELVHQS